MITKADILEAREQGVQRVYNNIYAENQTFIDFVLGAILAKALKEGVAEAYIRQVDQVREVDTVSYKVNGNVIICDYVAFSDVKKWLTYSGYTAELFVSGGFLVTCR